MMLKLTSFAWTVWRRCWQLLSWRKFTNPDDKRIRSIYFLQSQGQSDKGSFGLNRQKDASVGSVCPSGLPLPDEAILKYGSDPTRYLKTGERDIRIMKDALARHGVDSDVGPGNFLEFGCANARVIRWLSDWASQGEGWGVDFNSAMMMWCHQNLSPPFHFAVSTLHPRLSFSDHHFDLVFAFSVFTHIGDMYFSWICEMRRIIRPGGLFYFTIHDEVAKEIQTKLGSNPQKRRNDSEVYQLFLENDSDFCCVGRDWYSLISFKREYLIEHLSSYFEILEFVERAMGDSQTGVLVRRKPT